MTANEIKARNGVWTPWALVLCVECDYAELARGDRAKHYTKHFEAVSKMDRAAEIARPEGDLMGVCNLCHHKCWVRQDVALLQQVGFKSSDLDWEGPFGWSLEQTGGMCAALVFRTDDREIVVTAMDGDFFVGEYARIPDDSDEEPWIDAIRTWQSASLYEGGELKEDAAIDVLVEECARKAIEFIRNPEVSS